MSDESKKSIGKGMTHENQNQIKVVKERKLVKEYQMIIHNQMKMEKGCSYREEYLHLLKKGII